MTAVAPAESGIPSAWAMHLILVDEDALVDDRTARERAEFVLEAIDASCRPIAAAWAGGQDLNFRPTYNLIKVMKMSQIIAQLKRNIEELQERVERAERRVEQEQQEREQERERVERERQEYEERIRELERRAN